MTYVLLIFSNVSDAFSNVSPSKLQRKKNPAAEALLSIKVENMQYSLDQILMQPITHQTQFLQDVQILLQNTPPHHSDYDKFRSIIHRTMEDMNHGSKAQLKLRRNRRPGSVIQPNAWKIVKNAVMVEWRSGKRKMERATMAVGILDF